MTRSLKASLMTVLSVALSIATVDGFAAPKLGGSRGPSNSKSGFVRKSAGSKSFKTRVLSGTNNSTPLKRKFGSVGDSGNQLKPDFSNRKLLKPATSNITEIPFKAQLPNSAPRIGNLKNLSDKKFSSATQFGKGRTPLKLKALSIREKLNKPFVPLGQFNGNKLQEVLKHKQAICTTPGYQKCLKYANGCGWFQKPHCGWWGNLATCWYHHHHGCYCPDYYWDHCCHYRFVYIVCPATPEYAASYWYFGCDVVMVPGIGYGVAAVTPNSPAALVGIKQGDMITQVSDQTPEDDGLLATAVQQSNGQLNLTVLRDGSDEAEAMQIALRRIQKSSL
jgi:hypothetical protein